VLTAENVTASDKEMMKRVLAPVIAVGVPVLGAGSSAQESIQLAIAELWPIIPHHLCQFHVLREASRPIYDALTALQRSLEEVEKRGQQ
jgi:hypothetical protein